MSAVSKRSRVIMEAANDADLERRIAALSSYVRERDGSVLHVVRSSSASSGWCARVAYTLPLANQRHRVAALRAEPTPDDRPPRRHQEERDID